MLNVYKYFEEPDTLPLYQEASEGFKTMKLLIDWLLDDEEAQGYTKEDISAKIKPYMHLIAKSAEPAYLYADYFLRSRYPDGEKAISGVPHYALDYAISVLAKDPNWQYKSGRWPQAEPAIMVSGDDAVIYAKRVLANEPTWPHKNGQWPEAEPHIMKDPESALNYAINVRKARWPEAEPYIKKDSDSWEYYISTFNLH